MGVRPSHRGLEHQVQTIQTDFDRHLDPSPDNRFNVVKLNPESGNGGGGHARRLRAS